MPKLRPLRKPEDIAAVPPDRPVLIDVSEDPIEIEAGEVEIEKVEAKPEPRAEPDIEVDAEPENPLAKQLAEMTKAEEAQRQRAEAAQRLARDREQELIRERQEVVRERGGREQAEYDAVLNAMGAAQAEADTAERDLEAAQSSADFKAAAAAQRRLSTAVARLDRLEDGKAVFEARREEAKARPAPAPAPAPASDSIEQKIDAMNHLSGRQRDWLKRHSDAITDGRKNTRLGAYHLDALDAGHSEDSDAYYQFLEEKLGYRKAAPPVPKPDPDDEPEPQTRRSPPVSAPVSRDTPSMSTGRRQSTRVELSPEQRDAARISGVDERTYALGVLELEKRKKAGMYPDR